MKFFFSSITLLFILNLNATSQSLPALTSSITNRTVWADGTEKDYVSNQNKKITYFENYLEGRFSFGENITAGLRYTTLQPSYWGERLQGSQSLDKKWLQFKNENLIIKLGNSYAIWGRGLVLALQEDFDLGLDSGIEGVIFEYSKGPVKLETLRGRSENDPAGYTKTNDIQGANLEIDLKYARVSSSFINTIQENYPDLRLSGSSIQSQYKPQNIGLFSLYWEGAWQTEANKINNSSRGWFSSLSFARRGFSVQVDYKDYNFRLFNGNLLPYQSPPVVVRDLISKLMSSHPHNPRYDDEVGFQTEINYKVSRTVGSTFYMAQSSIHHNSPIPSLEQRHSPFSEYMLEANWKVAKSKTLRAQYSHRKESIWNSYFETPSLWNERNGLLASYQSPFIKRVNFELLIEQMFTNDKLKLKNYRDSYINLTFAKPGLGSLAFLFETTTDDNEVNGPSWLALESSFIVQKGVQILLFAGEQRGGIVCSSGRCRPVNPFQGVRLSVEATF